MYIKHTILYMVFFENFEPLKIFKYSGHKMAVQRGQPQKGI